ncbi:MAG: hypothetical protein QMD36_05060 [Candidatus Aenigmarchaeota archaeon]|nr:hypothetical protein [Candidatus Aenigmarchaeota archaeon]
MKALNFGKFGLIIFLTLLMTIQTVSSLGVTQPIPIDLKLLRGDAARFYFEIQATMDSKQYCTYSVTGLDPLVISFDKKEVVVNAGDIKNIYGTVSVPIDAPIKTYDGTLIVSCKPHVELEASGSVIQQTMGVKFVIDVIEKLEERVVREIPEKEKPKVSPLSLILLIIVLILSIVGFYLTRKKERK